MDYREFELDEDEYCLMNQDIRAVETLMTSYCLMLPLVTSGKFTGDYTVVYSDWDVSLGDFEKGLPNICEFCFECDVMG